MFAALIAMMLDMLAAVARKDYEDRRRRQAQGVAKAKAAGAYRGPSNRSIIHHGSRSGASDESNFHIPTTAPATSTVSKMT
jgi:DNA invertase Pin-like site-specific DNA recombinase